MNEFKEGDPSVQVTISARHGHLSTTTQERIEEKVEKLRRFYDRVTSIAVTVDLENEDSPHVEVRVMVEHHDDFLAADNGPQVSTALDSVVHKLETQLRKYKEKLTGHRSTGLKHLPTDREDAVE